MLSLAGQPITLAPGQSLVVHVTAATTSASCATYNNSASLVSTNDGSPTAGPIAITVNCGDLAITKTADAPSVSAGSPIGYVVTVTNNGAGAVTGLTVSDTLPTTPPGLAWSIDAAGSSPGWTIAGGVLGFGPASLAAGASVHVHITSPTTGATCGTVSNSATADSTNDGSPAVGPIAIVVNCPDLGLTKTADAASASAGDPIGYTLTISNTGQGNATGVELADSLPGGNAATPVTWVIDGTTGNPGSFSLTGGPGSQVLSLAGQPITLAPGQSLVVHVTAATTSASCATYNNSASLVSTNDGSPTAGPIAITVNCGDLAITKTADAPSVSAGSPIGYVVTVTNNGAGAVTGLTVSDTLPTTPPGLAWSIDAAGSSPGWTIAGGVLGFGPASLAAGASVHVHITSPTTGATCGTVSNSATADSTNDGSPAVGPIAIVVNCPDLGLTKTADAASASAGDPIGYTLTISNTGQGNATGVELADSLPGGNAATPVTWVIDGTTGNPGSFSLTGGPGSQVLSLAGQPITLAPGQSLGSTSRRPRPRRAAPRTTTAPPRQHQRRQPLGHRRADRRQLP